MNKLANWGSLRWLSSVWEEKDEKYKKYTITFPNQSTIESIN